MSLAIAFGCGKKINDPKTSDSGRTTQSQTTELSETFTLEVNEAVSSVKAYTLPRNAWFKLPAKLTAKEASAAGKVVKIFYNMESSGNYEFHCFYKSIALASELAFEKCQSSDDITIISNVDDLVKMEFPVDKGTQVQMHITNPSGSNIKIDSTYIVDWK